MILSFKKSFSLLCLFTLIVFFALLYVIQLNEMHALTSNLFQEEKRVRELNLLYQQYRGAFFAGQLLERMARVKLESNLQQVNEFTLLEIRNAQLSLHPRSYE